MSKGRELKAYILMCYVKVNRKPAADLEVLNMSIWKARIQAFVSICAGWLCRHTGRHAHADTLSTVQPTQDEYAAEREMNRKRICELEGLLAQMQKECCTLKKRLSSSVSLSRPFSRSRTTNSARPSLMIVPGLRTASIGKS